MRDTKGLQNAAEEENPAATGKRLFKKRNKT